MHLNPERLRRNIEQASTEDLMARATIWREEMEPEALDLIDAELRKRGIGAAELQAHGEQHRLRAVRGPDGRVLRCSRCQRPAVTEGWGWHYLWGLLPLFPRRFAWCEEHRPR
jgi:hypothetical protein